MKNYETGARERYGNTTAYREHEQGTKNDTKEKRDKANDGAPAIFVEPSTDATAADTKKL